MEENTQIIGNILKGLYYSKLRSAGTISVKSFKKKKEKQNGLVTKISFKSPKHLSFFGNFDEERDPVYFNGSIGDQNGKVVGKVQGVDTKSFTCDGKILWQNTRQFGGLDVFHFDDFMIQINDSSDELKTKLPPTDARFRRDVQLLEMGLVDEAEQVNDQLELANLKRHEASPGPYQPLWFGLVSMPDGSFKYWKSNGQYWQRHWDKCEDIGFHNY